MPIKPDSFVTREIVKVLNERPEVLRVFFKGPEKVLTIHGDWNIRIAARNSEMIEAYRKAVIWDTMNPPMVVTMLAGRASSKIRMTRHPVALVPLTVLLERLKPAAYKDCTWGIG